MFKEGFAVWQIMIEVGEAIPVFTKRIFDEEGQDIEVSSKRAFVPEEGIKQILGL